MHLVVQLGSKKIISKDRVRELEKTEKYDGTQRTKITNID